MQGYDLGVIWFDTATPSNLEHHVIWSAPFRISTIGPGKLVCRLKHREFPSVLFSLHCLSVDSLD